MGITTFNHNTIKKALETIEQTKNQLQKITGYSRLGEIKLSQELADVKKELSQITSQISKKRLVEKKAMSRLLEVKNSFSQYSAEDIHRAYDQAYKAQIALIKLREKEKRFQVNKKDLTTNLLQHQTTTTLTEELVSQLRVVLNFLCVGLRDIGSQMGEAQQAQQMAISIIKAQEEERKRVAREIHDAPAQSMANIVMRAEYCQKLLELHPEKVRDELIALQDLVRASLADVRKIISDLRPMVLDELGLAPAIKRYLSDYEAQSGVKIKYIFTGRPKRLDNSIEIALYRIIQEAVSNIKKHARAKNANIKMNMLSDKVNIFIKDDGAGFDLSQILAGGENEKYGLLGIQERVKILKGELNISTVPGRGTEISISIPTGYTIPH